MHRWKLSALAAAALVSVSLTASNAWALALGRLSIQSALGEPLRAEVELPQITAAEADSLQATIASPAVFRAQGMQYTAAVSQFRVVLQRRPDGSAMLRLSSTQPVSEPFVDLVIDASWAAGQVVRSYTLLLDPPAARQPAPAAGVAPQVGAAVPTPQTAAPVRNAPAPTPAPRAAPAPAPAPAAAVTVRSGDTASRIAQANRPAGVSLDQMLVAMLRANPQAFISGNVNRMRAGAVLEMPDQAAAQATSIPEARQIVAAQSQDFNRYRRQLAAAAPQAPVAAAQRSASGNVEAQVEDRKPTTAAPDKLTLSKGALAADERLAQEKQAQSQSERLAELSRNLNELQNVASGAAAPAGAPTPAGAPAMGVPTTGIPATGVPATGIPATGAAVTAPTAPPTDAAAAATPAAGDGTAAPAPDAATPAPEAGEPQAAAPTSAMPAAPAAEPTPAAAPAEPAAPAAPAAPGFMETLRENPLLPLAGAGLLALLLGLIGYRRVQRRRTPNGANDTLLHNDSFFDVGQGQRVDTANTQFGGSTAYSHSQLDTGGEVDPVAEADVYLAYGRDLQAEEILKEALRTQPERLALHLKLADIYAKRQDRKAFEAVAQTVFALTQGKGAEWLQLAEHGRALDAANPLYQAAPDALPGGTPPPSPTKLESDSRAAAQASVAAALGGLAASAASATPAPVAPSGLEQGLDLDLPSAPAAAPAAPTDEWSPQSAGTLDFEPIEPIWKQPAATLAEPAPDSAADALADLPAVPAPDTVAGPAPSDTLPDLEFTLDEDADAPAVETPKAPVAEDEAPEPDLADKDDTPAFDIPPVAAPLPELPSAELPDVSTATPAAPPPAPTAATAAPASPAPAPAPAAAPAFDFLEFDLGNLSLDLGPTAPAAALSQSSQAAAEDPLATKLALAQEFAAIGDSEGARTLIEEVIDEAEGELKERAQRLLSEID